MPIDDEAARPPAPQSPVRPNKQNRAEEPYASTLSGVVRLAWVLFLPLLILLHLGWLLARDVGATDLPSITFWLVVASLVVARFVDVAYFRGETSEGGRATMGDVRRFAFTAVGLCGAAWLAIHLT